MTTVWCALFVVWLWMIWLDDDFASSRTVTGDDQPSWPAA